MRREWAIFATGLTLAACAATALGLFWRADAAVYDLGAVPAPPPEDIVIVGIDDASLQAFGRWPWPRSRHADLLTWLKQAGVRGVALDLILTESDPGTARDDERLADALQAGPPTVLPLLVESPLGLPLRERLPVPVIAQAAAGVGHVQLDLDRDGVARSVYLWEGSGLPNRPHLMLRLLQFVQPDLYAGAVNDVERVLEVREGAWVRDDHVQIPFLGPPGHFVHYAYHDVAEGRVPAAKFRDKLVLIGVTAQGGGDAYPTPLSGQSTAMPGVEINANILHGLRQGTLIRTVPLVLSVLLSGAIVFVGCMALRRLSPRRSLAAIALLWMITLLGCVFAVRVLHREWPGSATLFALLLSYPIWSWLRLEMTARYLDSEIALLGKEDVPFLKAHVRRTPPRQGDVFRQRVESLRQATASVRELRRLLADTVRSVPDAMLVLDVEDAVVLANAAAARLLGSHDEQSILPPQWQRLASKLALRSPGALAQAQQQELEIHDEVSGSDYLVRIVPLFADATTANRMGTLVSLVNISKLRHAQREQEDFVRFLSHDLKSPASSLMGLAQLQRDPQRALPAEELCDRLDGLGQRTLDLVDGFVTLGHAELTDPARFLELDLRDALQDAFDEVWAFAESRHTRLDLHVADEALVVIGDRQLLARAVANLLNNAVKFSGRYSVVTIRGSRYGAQARISVIDEGPGVPAEMQGRLFTRFGRARASGKNPDGSGLGLAFVRTVAEKHRGSAMNVSQSRGARFDLHIPLQPLAGAAGAGESGRGGAFARPGGEQPAR